jgi:DNA-binding transcriptional LysR family regulator
MPRPLAGLSSTILIACPPASAFGYDAALHQCRDRSPRDRTDSYNAPVDLKQLRALLAIADTGSVTRAAEILHIVQPALSRQLKLLEEEIGVPLFDRERHGMVLTGPGRKFVEHVRRGLSELDSGKSEISPKKKVVEGSVVVGLLPSLADLLVTALMGRVRHCYPAVDLRSYIAYVDDMQRSLEQGQVDVALLYLRPDAAERIPNEQILEESLFLVGPPEAALDMDNPVPLASLSDVPLILPSRSQGIRAIVEREFVAAGVHMNVTAETSSANLQKTLVMKGLGMSILSGAVVAEEVAQGILTACPISALNLKRPLSLARSPAKAMTVAASKVRDELRDAVLALVAEGRWPGAVIC